MYKRNQKKWYKHLDFILVDLLCIEISFLLAFIIRFDDYIKGAQHLFQKISDSAPYSRFMVYIMLIHIVLVMFMEPYSRILYRNAAEECKKVIVYNVCLLLGAILIMFMEHSSILYSRIVIFTFSIIDTVLMFILRHIAKKVLRKRINKEENQSCMLLVASKNQLDEIINNFHTAEISTVRIVGIALIDSDMNAVTDTMYKDIPIIGGIDSIYEFARTNVVDEVMLCMDGEKARDISEVLVSMGITTHINVQSLVHIPNATMNRINGIPVVTSSVHYVTSRQLMVKRIIDIFFGLLGSIVTILVTLFVAPAIWIADPGPVFFRQERVGRNGRTFKIWKFRTMYKDAEARKAELMSKNEMNGLMFKMEDDPRIIGYGKKISLGALLRKLSIDELPQSFNILEGSMSVVGTRPPTVQEYEQYELHHKGRLAIKPGLTGMWQVSGRNKITDFEEVVKLDKYYIDNFNLRLDLEIILKTIKVVLFRDGSM